MANKPTPIAPAASAAVLDALPGLMGATDKYLSDAAGKKVGFVVLVFVDGQALFVTNGDRDAAMANVRAFSASTDVGGENAID